MLGMDSLVIGKDPWRDFLGQGESGWVMRGTCQSQPAAIKFIFCVRNPLKAPRHEASIYLVCARGSSTAFHALGTPCMCAVAAGGKQP